MRVRRVLKRVELGNECSVLRFGEAVADGIGQKAGGLTFDITGAGGFIAGVRVDGWVMRQVNSGMFFDLHANDLPVVG